MMRPVRGRIGRSLAATLLALAIGLQLLEASGRWDRTLQDSADETVVVTLVLCVGAALVVAAAARPHISLSPTTAPIAIRLATASTFAAPHRTLSLADTSPPISLRV